MSTKSTEEEGNEWARIVWHRFDAVKRMPGSKQMGRFLVDRINLK